MQGLLTRNPRDRMTAAQALDHPWVREGGEASEEPLDSTLVRLLLTCVHQLLASAAIPGGA